MISMFMLVPLMVCLYEIVSMILPLKISAWAKVFAAVVLLAGLAKNILYRRTATGFDTIDTPYFITLATSTVFNFIIIAVFVLLVKDSFFIAWKIFARSPFPHHYASLFVFSITLVATLYGTYEGLRTPDINRHTVTVPGLGQELDGLKVAMLVDIHADSLTNRAAVQAIVDRTNSLNPDVILIPGDFVDGQVASRRKDLEPLSGLRAKFGVFGSTGNHEYYSDYRGWMKVFPELGVRMLMNEHVVISSGDSRLVIAGVPDPTGSRMGIEERSTELALQDAPEGVPVILIDHQPRDAKTNAKLGVTLQLSGHTHGGQMPVIYAMVRRANAGYVRGWYDVDGMRMYVSPGTSQWNGFACRLFDPAEITLFTLVNDFH